jgi:hypothetical protein
MCRVMPGYARFRRGTPLTYHAGQPLGAEEPRAAGCVVIEAPRDVLWVFRRHRVVLRRGRRVEAASKARVARDRVCVCVAVHVFWGALSRVGGKVGAQLALGAQPVGEVACSWSGWVSLGEMG